MMSSERQEYVMEFPGIYQQLSVTDYLKKLRHMCK